MAKTDEMTVDEQSLTSYVWTCFPDGFPYYDRTAVSPHSEFVGSRVYVCLSVTCHLLFWQKNWNLLQYTTAVTQGWNGYQKESGVKVNPGKENSHSAPARDQTQDLHIMSPVLSTEQ